MDKGTLKNITHHVVSAMVLFWCLGAVGCFEATAPLPGIPSCS